MRRKTALLIIAATAFVLGWLLPVVDDYRGWQAFRVALSPLWPYESFRFSAWYSAALTTASGLSNAVFVLAFADAVFTRRVGARLLSLVLFAAAIVNLHWLVRAGAQFTQLQVGYYVWIAAFPVLAFAARER
jgi:hypothetical protein